MMTLTLACMDELTGGRLEVVAVVAPMIMVLVMLTIVLVMLVIRCSKSL